MGGLLSSDYLFLLVSSRMRKSVFDNHGVRTVAKGKNTSVETDSDVASSPKNPSGKKTPSPKKSPTTVRKKVRTKVEAPKGTAAGSVVSSPAPVAEPKPDSGIDLHALDSWELELTSDDILFPVDRLIAKLVGSSVTSDRVRRGSYGNYWLSNMVMSRLWKTWTERYKDVISSDRFDPIRRFPPFCDSCFSRTYLVSVGDAKRAVRETSLSDSEKETILSLLSQYGEELDSIGWSPKIPYYEIHLIHHMIKATFNSGWLSPEWSGYDVEIDYQKYPPFGNNDSMISIPDIDTDSWNRHVSSAPAEYASIVSLATKAGLSFVAANRYYERSPMPFFV